MPAARFEAAAGALRRWLFRVNGPEAAPIRLEQRRVFVLPTRAGLGFAATILLLLTASINYQLSLGFVLTFLLAGLGVVAIIHTFRNLVRLEVSPGRCRPVFAGGSALFTLRFTNSRNDARRSLIVFAPPTPGRVVDLPAHSVLETEVQVPATRRGWLHLGRVTIESSYPLGLIRAWSYIHPRMRCLVWPHPEANAPALPSGNGDREPGRAAMIGADDFAGLRSHQPADPPRRVAWKASTRENAPLQTKQFSSQAGSSLWLEWYDLPEVLDLEARLSRLTAWVLAARDARMPFGLRLPSACFPPSADADHALRCLRALALHGLESD
jgi:uncharacterized protein (DUF58 family)